MLLDIITPLGYRPEEDKSKSEHSGNGHDREGDIFWEMNAKALAAPEAWTHKLPQLYRLRKCRGPANYEAVPMWRESSTPGKTLEQRNPNLKISRRGITDFGTGDKYSPVNLVMKCFGWTEPHKALEWLEGQLQCAPKADVDFESLLKTESPDIQPEDEPQESIIRVGPQPLRRLNERTHPRREWVLAQHYMLGTLTTTIAPGGFGKSSLGLVEGMSMALGRDLIHGEKMRRRYRVWYHNAEEKLEELERRLIAAMKLYGISQEELDGWFFMTGRELEIKVARGNSELRLAKTTIQQLTDSIMEDRIEVAIFDPLISFHGTSEKSNENMRGVCEVFAKIADVTGCAIELFHHTRKMQPGQEEYTAADARGASSVIDAVRSARILNRMTDSEANKLGLDTLERRRCVRLDRDKANMAPAENALWLKFQSVDLDNGDEELGLPGDNVGVLVRWTPTPPVALMTDEDRDYFCAAVTADRDYREDQQATKWVGHLIAERLSLDVGKKYDKACALAAIEALVKDRVFRVVQRKDKRGTKRGFIAPGYNFRSGEASAEGGEESPPASPSSPPPTPL
jgi:RecA-family ATPase